MQIFNFHHCEQRLKRRERRHITITPRGLQSIIRTLRALGFKIISVADILRHPAWIDEPRAILLTFDDGYENTLTQALPVLETEECPATTFVLPGLYGSTNLWDQGQMVVSERDALMTRKQLDELVASPFMTLGSHGLTHQDFTKLSNDALEAELMDSYSILQKDFGEKFLPVLAYPWGYYGEREIHALAKTPYQYAFTVETRLWQASDSPFQVPRYSVYYRDGNPLIFMAKLLRHGILSGFAEFQGAPSGRRLEPDFGL